MHINNCIRSRAKGWDAAHDVGVLATARRAGVGYAVAALLGVAYAGDPVYVTFDVPGAGTGQFEGTVPINASPDGSVTGFIRRNDLTRGGFVRDPQGDIVTFDAPNAGTGADQGTHAYSITPGGAVTGWFYDSSFVAHGFERNPEGAITVFDAPGAGSGAGQGTFVFYPAIAPSGTITGYLVDANNVDHGFVRDRAEHIVTFDAPAASSAGGGTVAAGIDAQGVIIGYFFDASGIPHGFIRDVGGQITSFDVPGAALGTFPADINTQGAISGNYVDENGVSHCFVRAEDGNVASFDAPPQAPTGSSCIFAFIAQEGTVAATYVDTSGNPHAFLRDKQGSMQDIDVPGAVNGTEANGITDDGSVTGDYRDGNFVLHGFIRKERCY